MRIRSLALTCSIVAAAIAGLHAQGREWTTSAGDIQRTAWVPSDGRLTKDAVQQGGFQFLWKAKLENESRQLNSLTEPILLDRLIGYRGFKALAFLGGSADRVFAIDTDLARPYWTTHLTYAVATGGQPPSTLECPGGLMATPSRRVSLGAPAGFRAAGGGGARSASAVGEPGAGAAVLSERRAAGSPQRPAPPRDPVPPPSPRAARAGAPTPFGGVEPLYVMGSDGLLRTLRVSDGAVVGTPIPFLPPSARPSSLTSVDGVVYTTTSNGCGAAPNGVWALDLTSDNKVTTWQTGSAHVAGNAGPAFGADGTLYVATTRAASGTERYANAVVALDGLTLEVKDWFTADTADFNASPVVFRYKDRDLVAAPGNDGRLYLLDAASLGGADHRTPLHVTSKYSAAHSGGGITTWEDDTTRWIVASAEGESALPGNLVAFKLVENGGRLTLVEAWRSRPLISPLAPIVISGLVVGVSSGEYRGGPATLTAAQRRRRAVPAVMYVLDGATGKQLWSSRQTITSFARASMSAGAGQVYLVTYDNHLYAFGIPMEH